MRRPRLGIIPGDPSGIGPELIAKLLQEPAVLAQADVLLSVGTDDLIVLFDNLSDALVVNRRKRAQLRTHLVLLSHLAVVCRVHTSLIEVRQWHRMRLAVTGGGP